MSPDLKKKKTSFPFSLVILMETRWACGEGYEEVSVHRPSAGHSA